MVFVFSHYVCHIDESIVWNQLYKKTVCTNYFAVSFGFISKQSIFDRGLKLKPKSVLSFIKVNKVLSQLDITDLAILKINSPAKTVQ